MSESLEAARQHEREKYLDLYGWGDTYGRENHGADALPLIREMRPATLIDVGCGRNLFCPRVRLHGVEAFGVDFACESADVIAPAHRLPVDDNAFEVLTAFDLLEHLLPAEAYDVLDEFARVSSRWILSICYRDSINRVNGETLHPTVRPEAWWIDTLRVYGAVSYWRGYLLVRCHDRHR